MPKQIKSSHKLIFIIIFVALIAYAWYSFIFSSQKETTKQLKIEHQNSYESYQRAKLISGQLDKLLMEKDSLKALWEKLKVRVPLKEEVKDIINNIRDFSIETGIYVFKIDFASRIIYDDYQKVEYNMKLKAGYQSLRKFITEIANLQRIVSIENLKIEALNPSREIPTTLEANCKLIIYALGSDIEGL